MFGIGNILGKLLNPTNLLQNLISNFTNIFSAFQGQQKQNDVSRMLNGVLNSVQTGHGLEGPSVASNQRGMIAGTVGGKTLVYGGDHDRFGFNPLPNRSYNVLNDTGLNINGKFSSDGRDGCVMTQTGMTLTGPGGRSDIKASANPPGFYHNGVKLRPGQNFQTADGGKGHVSPDGKSLTVTSREGYEVTQSLIPDKRLDGRHSSRVHISVKTPPQGIAKDCRMPGGILGETFDYGLGKQKRTEQGRPNYEVPGGIFGTPKGSMHGADLKPLFDLLHHCGLDHCNPRFPENNPVTGTPINWADELGKLSDMIRMLQDFFGGKGGDYKVDDGHNITLPGGEISPGLQFPFPGVKPKPSDPSTGDEKLDRLNKLLQIALASGNINLAMMIFGQLETKSANDLTKTLVQKVQKMQDEKRAITKQIGGLGNKPEDMKKMQDLQNQVGEKSDDINMLNSFIKDVAQNKQTIQELVSAFTKSEFDTTKSLLSKFS